MNDKELKQSCKNCKHFYQHFVIDNTTFMKTNCGHCGLNLLKPGKRYKFEVKENCEKWESNADERVMQTHTLHNSLIKMEKHLYEIKQILQFDKK